MRIAAAIALLAVSAFSFPTTPHAQAWTVQYRPNGLMGVVNFLAPDYYSNLYAIAKRSDGGSSVRILDRSGNFTDNIDTESITDQALDGQSSTLYYVQQNNGQTVLGNHYLFNSGYGWAISSNNSPIATGLDKFGIPIVVSSDSGNGTLRVFRSGVDTGVLTEWDNTSLIPDKAVVTRDYVFVSGHDAQSVGTKTALLYDTVGNLLWSRSFTNVLAFHRFFTIVGFCEDGVENTYLAVNEVTGSPSVSTFTIRYIEPVFGNQDQWVYTGNGSMSLFTAPDPNHVYYAFDNSGRRLGMLNGGTSVWSFSVPVGSMACPNDNSGSVMVATITMPCPASPSRSTVPPQPWNINFRSPRTPPTISGPSGGTHFVRQFISEGEPQPAGAMHSSRKSSRATCFKA